MTDETPAHLLNAVSANYARRYDALIQRATDAEAEVHALRHALRLVEQAIQERDLDLVRGQLHHPSCPYTPYADDATVPDDVTCTCPREHLAARWKARWVLMKAERDRGEQEREALRAERDVADNARAHFMTENDTLKAQVEALTREHERLKAEPPQAGRVAMETPEDSTAPLLREGQSPNPVEKTVRALTDEAPGLVADNQRLTEEHARLTQRLAEVQDRLSRWENLAAGLKTEYP